VQPGLSLQIDSRRRGSNYQGWLQNLRWGKNNREAERAPAMNDPSAAPGGDRDAAGTSTGNRVSISRRAGRPRKARPTLGADVTAGMSTRDIAAALGTHRNDLQRMLWMAELPKEDFDAYLLRCRLDNRPASSREVEIMARRQARNQAGNRNRRCPHCGGAL